MRKLVIVILFFFLAGLVSAQEKVDQDMMKKIRNEGLNNSKVMDIAFHLTDVSGPRLTKSPGYDRAATWAISELKKWGLENSGLEPWGEFGKSWELQKSYVAMSAPYYRPLIAFPKTWTKGTNGLQNAEVLLVTARDSAELEQYVGRLKGKVLIINRTDTLKPSFKADAYRFTDEELEKMANARAEQPRQPG